MGSKMHLQVTFELESNDNQEALEILNTLERALSIVCELSPFVEELDKHYFKDGNEVDFKDILVEALEDNERFQNLIKDREKL